MDDVTRGGVVVEKNSVEEVEFAKRSVEEELAVALAHAPVAEDEFTVAGVAPDRVRVVHTEKHGVAARNGAVLG